MLKTLRDMVVGAIAAFAAVATVSYAVVGIPPEFGFQMVDGQWLRGVAGGQNFSFQSGITAKAGGGQTACTNIPSSIYLNQVDTVASSNDSVCLPFALAGANLQLRNNGANQLAVFAQSGTNAATGSTDSINGTSNGSSYPLNTTTTMVTECFAAKNGAWSCVRGGN